MNTRQPFLEVCVDSYDSAMAAVRAGADRLELCSALQLGGLTPWAALLTQIRKSTDIPIRCLIRPRPGDFCYTEQELELMCTQILQLSRAGASGFVVGALNPDGTLNTEAMRHFMGARGGKGVTLHRCVDVSLDPLRTYAEAGALGVDTVLTSGAAETCLKGLSTLGKMLTFQGISNGPTVLIGSGVDANAIRQIRARYPSAHAFHMSGKSSVPSKMVYRRLGVPMGAPGFDEWSIQQTNESNVRAAISALLERR